MSHCQTYKEEDLQLVQLSCVKQIQRHQCCHKTPLILLKYQVISLSTNVFLIPCVNSKLMMSFKCSDEKMGDFILNTEVQHGSIN